MRYSQLLIPTVKEVPAEAEIISHQLMIRAGFIRKLASGTYTYLPLGWRCPAALSGFHVPLRADPAGLLSRLATGMGSLHASLHPRCLECVPQSLACGFSSRLTAPGGDGSLHLHLYPPDARKISPALV
jgi:hypothetical protein